MTTVKRSPPKRHAGAGRITDALDAAADAYAAEHDITYWPPCSLRATSNGADYDAVEMTIEKHVRHGNNPWNVKGQDGQDIHEALQWCSSCTMRTYCQQLMTSCPYTGIAGGILVQHGKPIPPERMDRGAVKRQNAAAKRAQEQPSLYESVEP